MGEKQTLCDYVRYSVTRFSPLIFAIVTYCSLFDAFLNMGSISRRFSCKKLENSEVKKLKVLEQMSLDLAGKNGVKISMYLPL